ncbi:hypothetical protein [Chitinophaga agri]|uniref:Uncharacterized protein n=1 Tax=Chitinophaga agri TaxID=2703787 RepID=A0A6B9ZBI6_9BACT|nr:hypothetical protein [Chitinophaga agri]QHS58465.1 hypothetical protein GWR21_02300 [Chitinophaga agri]
MRKIHLIEKMLNKMNSFTKIYITFTVLVILVRTVDYTAGFSFRGYWTDAIILLIWVIASLVLFCYQRQLKWVRIYTSILGIGALLFLPMAGFLLLMGQVGMPGYRFDFYREVPNGHNFVVTREMDTPRITLYKVCGPFERRLAVFYLEDYEYRSVGALRRAVSVQVTETARHVEATFLSPDSGSTFSTAY